MISLTPATSCLLSVLLLSSGGQGASVSQDPSADDVAQRARNVLENEAAIESLRGPIGELTRSIQNLALPGERARTIFAGEDSRLEWSYDPTTDELIMIKKGDNEISRDRFVVVTDWPAAHADRPAAN